MSLKRYIPAYVASLVLIGAAYFLYMLLVANYRAPTGVPFTLRSVLLVASSVVLAVLSGVASLPRGEKFIERRFGFSGAGYYSVVAVLL